MRSAAPRRECANPLALLRTTRGGKGRRENNFAPIGRSEKKKNADVATDGGIVPASSVPFQAAARSIFPRDERKHRIVPQSMLALSKLTRLPPQYRSEKNTQASASSSSPVVAAARAAAAKPARVAPVRRSSCCSSHGNCRQQLRGSLVLARAEEENQAAAGAEMEVCFFSSRLGRDRFLVFFFSTSASALLCSLVGFFS